MTQAEEMDRLIRELHAYHHMRRIRQLTIEMAQNDITTIDEGIEVINNRIKELENVQGTVSTVDTGSEGHQPEQG